jgi:hypothetical protein
LLGGYEIFLQIKDLQTVSALAVRCQGDSDTSEQWSRADGSQACLKEGMPFLVFDKE